MAEKRQPATLRRLRKRIDGWRANRKKLHPMPARLWIEAVTLASELGVNPVSHALGLNYESLKRRVEDEGVGSGGETSGKFVELSGAQVLGPQVVVGPLVELVDASGARLTMQLPAGNTLDVAGLVAAFRGRPV